MAYWNAKVGLGKGLGTPLFKHWSLFRFYSRESKGSHQQRELKKRRKVRRTREWKVTAKVRRRKRTRGRARGVVRAGKSKANRKGRTTLLARQVREWAFPQKHRLSNFLWIRCCAVSLSLIWNHFRLVNLNFPFVWCLAPLQLFLLLY